jgi:hypothetical protein
VKFLTFYNFIGHLTAFLVLALLDVDIYPLIYKVDVSVQGEVHQLQIRRELVSILTLAVTDYLVEQIHVLLSYLHLEGQQVV